MKSRERLTKFLSEPVGHHPPHRRVDSEWRRKLGIATREIFSGGVCRPQLMRGPLDDWLGEWSWCWSAYEALSEHIAHALAAH
jgi:hypothetical protein